MNRLLLTASLLTLGLSACNRTTPAGDSGAQDSTHTQADTLRYPEEKHLKNVRQLTFGGNNAEAYFSPDGQWLVFQSDFGEWGVKCDQIFRMNVQTGAPKGQKPTLLSTGKGRTTCSYFSGDGQSILYASTHLQHDTCPPVPERKVDGHYVWPIYAEYDIFRAGLDGQIQQQLTNSPGYDAEATVSRQGDRVVFTSTRSGDLELWTMKPDGSEQKQITDAPGYDGGAFFSPDGSKLVFRASRPAAGEELTTYRDLLAKNLVEPGALEIMTVPVAGGPIHQVTKLGGANWAPYYHPDGQRIIFASNHKSERGRVFNLFMIREDGTGLEQITFDKTFDSFPMFSPDGKYLVWASNRFNGGTHDTNIFIAEWAD